MRAPAALVAGFQRGSGILSCLNLVLIRLTPAIQRHDMYCHISLPSLRWAKRGPPGVSRVGRAPVPGADSALSPDAPPGSAARRPPSLPALPLPIRTASAAGHGALIHKHSGGTGCVPRAPVSVCATVPGLGPMELLVILHQSVHHCSPLH